MKIRMLHPFRAWQVGEVVDLPEDAACAWIDNGTAERVEEPADEPELDPSTSGDPELGVIEDPAAYAESLASGAIEEIPPDDPREPSPVEGVVVDLVPSEVEAAESNPAGPKTGRRK